MRTLRHVPISYCRVDTYHTTVRDETAQVQSAVAVFGSLQCLLDNRSLAELAILDGLVDAHNVLPHHTASADVQVADFRVAHQTLRQTDSEGGGLELSVTGGALGELVHDRGLCVGDGVSILGRVGGGDSPTVNDDCRCAEALESTMKARDKSGRDKKRGHSPAGRGSYWGCWSCRAAPQQSSLRRPARASPCAPSLAHAFAPVLESCSRCSFSAGGAGDADVLAGGWKGVVDEGLGLLVQRKSVGSNVLRQAFCSGLVISSAFLLDMGASKRFLRCSRSRLKDRRNDCRCEI